MSSRDNWERLVAAVVKREQIWQLCHQHSISTISSDDSNAQLLSFSSNNLEPVSVYPQTAPSVSQVRKKLFPAWFRIRKYRKKDSVNIPSKSDEDLVRIPAIHVGRLQRFSLEELQAATNDFSYENILPGAMNVYRGWLAGSQVAVKSYKQSDSRFAEI